MAIWVLAIASAGYSGDAAELPPGVYEVEFRVIVEGLRQGEPYSVDVVGDSGGRAALIADVHRLPAAAVDFEREVVLVFDLPGSSSCPYKNISKLGHDPATNIVYPLVATERGDTCIGDAGQHRIILAVPRASLPDRDFQLWISSPAGPPEGVTIPLVDAGTLTLTSASS
jgi:hypothetical protein